MKKIIVLISFLLITFSSIHSQISNYHAAVSVLGQINFTTKTSGTSDSQLNGPNGVAVDPKTGKVFIVDRSNHRILRWSSEDAKNNGTKAEAVFGQVNFTDKTSGNTSSKFNNPIGIHIDKNGTMWVGDFSNNRVLKFTDASNKNSGSAADAVIGQPDFSTTSSGKGKNKLNGPVGVFVDDNNNLWVSEFNNHRVIAFKDVSQKQNGADADLVFGQPDFESVTSGLTASKMANPNAVYVDKFGNLWISDYGNKRFLKYSNAINKSNGAEADGVLGQPNFTSNTAATTINGTGTTRYIWGDSSGRIYCVQEDNNRILVYENGADKPNGANADYVLGQPDFTTKTVLNPPTASSFNVPRAIFVDDTRNSFWVADYSNNRVLRFSLGQTGKYITVINPNGGEEWFKGTKQNITWISNQVTKVKIEFSHDNGTTWSIVGITDASNFSYEWLVPNDLTNNAKIKISDMDDTTTYDISDNTFKIVEPSYYVEVISPNGYQQWEANSSKKILFNSKGISNVKIEYSSDNGSTWNIITNSAPVSTGEYLWNIPSTIGNKFLIKLTGIEENVTDQSDNLFSIVTSKNLNNQDYIFFSDSPTKTYYDPSWGFANSPSTLELVGSKAPVATNYSLVGNYSIKLNWHSKPAGDWGLAIAGIGWVGRDVVEKDTLVINIFSEKSVTSSQLPKIYLEDLSNRKTNKANLADYVSEIKANQWNKVFVPLKWFKENAGSADIRSIKTIFFGQNIADDNQITFYIDDIRMIGGKPISGDLRKVVVVLGSSTAAGTGASKVDSSWVGRYRKYMLSKDPDSYLVNLAVGGYTSYDVMPSYFIAPVGKPSPKVENNITKALSFKPWAILINLPSNDANMNYTIEEQIFNLKSIINEALNYKTKVWITTTQPRNFSSQIQRNNLIEMKDSIKSIFKLNSVDVFTSLANADGTIKSIYNSGDGIHLNDAGHKIIFDKFVAAKVWETITGVEEFEESLPTSFALSQNFPNPFNPTTTIEFSLPTYSRVNLKVYDMIGREITTLASGSFNAGNYKIFFDASNLASGMYVYRLIANGENNSSFIKTMKMILIK